MLRSERKVCTCFGQKQRWTHAEVGDRAMLMHRSGKRHTHAEVGDRYAHAEVRKKGIHMLRSGKKVYTC